MDINYLKWKKPESLGEFIRLIYSFFWYFTLWVLTLELLYYLGIIKNIELTLIIFHIVVLVGSYYIFNFKKKDIIVKLYNFELSLGRKYLVLSDIVLHWITFLLLIFVIFRKKRNLMGTLNIKLLILFPLAYLILNNPIEVYQIEILGYKDKIIFENKPYEGHYVITPYHFNKKLAKKYIPSNHIDLGQGLLSLIEYVSDQNQK